MVILMAILIQVICHVSMLKLIDMSADWLSLVDSPATELIPDIETASQVGPGISTEQTADISISLADVVDSD